MSRFTRVLVVVAALVLFAQPASASFWESTTGPFAGYVRSLLVLSPDTLVAGTYFGGVYRSVDGGLHWTKTSAGLSDPHVFALMQAPGGALFAGTSGGGICRSSDRGVNWTPVNNGLTRMQVWCLAARTADTLYAGTYQGGVFRSVDAGATWALSSNGLTTSAALDVRTLVVAPGGRLFAGTYDYVYRSTDAGASWTAARTGLGNTYCWTLAVRPDGLLAVGTPNGCWISSNNGDSWSVSGLSTNISVMSIAARANGELFAGCGSGMWWSNDNGVTWNARNAGLSSTDIACVSVGAGSLVFAGSSNGGAFRSSDDGVNWGPVNTGIRETHIAGLALTPAGGWYAGSGGGVYRSVDQGANWTLTTLTNRNVAAMAASGGDLVAATAGWGVFHSSDAGANWTAAGTGLLDPNAWTLAVRPAGGVFVGGSIGVSRLDAYGGAWQSLAGFPAYTGVASLLVESTGAVLAGTLNAGLERSPDDGVTWAPANVGLGTQRVLALAEDHAGRLFLGTMANGVYRSTDGAATWQQLPGTSGYVNALAVNSGDAVFVAIRGGGVLRSLDHGSNWIAVADGLDGNDAITLAVDATDRLVAGCDHHGVYRSVARTAGVGPGVAAAPRFTALPNPSRGPVALRFEQPRPGPMRIDIYDTAGRRVRRMQDDAWSEGSHVVTWDGRDEAGRRVPAGLYLARVSGRSTECTVRIARVD